MILSFEQQYKKKMNEAAEAAANKGKEVIPPESREKEHVSSDKSKPFAYKPERPMDLPQGVLEIFKAFQNQELLADIENELKKNVPNGKAYHIDEIFGVDENGKSKFAKIDPKIRGQLKVTKCKLYVVGGAVRDFLLSIFHPNKLHKTPKNYNLATDARPKIIQLILMNAKPTPIRCESKTMGVVTAVVDGEKYEIETFRDEPNGNNEFITYSNAARDAKRRDFRINSMRYDIEKESVEDDVGGFGDITESPPKLRPNDPEVFKKDPHVAMRAFRLHGKINGGDHKGFDGEVAKALSNFDMGDKVDRKRVSKEFMDGLKVADNQANYIASFANFGKPNKNVLQQIFQGLDVDGKLNIPNNTHPHVALSLILKNNGPDNIKRVEAVLEKMGFGKDEINDVSFLLSLPKYHSLEQLGDFIIEMKEKAKKLVPSMIKNYVKWARLGNANIIEKMLHPKSVSQNHENVKALKEPIDMALKDPVSELLGH